MHFEAVTWRKPRFAEFMLFRIVSPAILRFKALKQIALKHALTKMAEMAIEIGPDLAAHIPPTPAEGEILRQIPSGIRIDHAVEKAPVKVLLDCWAGHRVCNSAPDSVASIG